MGITNSNSLCINLCNQSIFSYSNVHHIFLNVNSDNLKIYYGILYPVIPLIKDHFKLSTIVQIKLNVLNYLFGNFSKYLMYFQTKT